MASDIDTVAWAFKKHYEGGKQVDVAARHHVLFGKIAKRKQKLIGSAFQYAVRYQNPQGVSGKFADSQTAGTAAYGQSAGKQLAATPVLQYGTILIDGPSILRARGDKAAFYDLVSMESDGIHEEIGDNMAFLLYGDGTGARGRVSSEASEVLTLITAADARNFKIGMTLVADDAAAGTSLNAGTTYVTAVNPDAGTVTVEDASDAVIIANDYLFRLGDETRAMDGLAKCTPLTAPVAGSDSFRGIDRGTYGALLAGSRVDSTSSSIEENLGLAAIKVNLHGRKVTEAYLNPINVWAVARRRDAKVMYDGAGGTAGFGFEFITVETPAGFIKVYADPDCPTNRGWLCNPESHYLAHNDELIHVIRDDGSTARRSASTDSIEIRLRSQHNYIQPAPSDFAVFSI